MADSRINLLTSAPVTASDDFFVIDGATNGTRKLNAYAPNIGGLAAFNGSTVVDSLPTAAYFGSNKRVSIGYDNANNFGFVATQDSGISWQELRLNPYGGMVKVPASTASTSTITGAFVVGNGVDGGIGASGSIWSGGTLTATTGTNSGVLQLNLINNSAGNAASSLFRFNMGTRTATLQAYNDTHATLAGQLRIGTSNGDIVMIPSGVATTTFSASGTTVAGTLTSTGSLTSNSTITAANTIKYINSGVANGTTVGPFQADIGADGTLGALIVSVGGSPSATGSSRFGCISAGDVGAWRKFIVGSNTTAGGGQVLIPASDASSSTISGALVISGGVGIAKRIHSGEGLTTGGDNETHISFVRNGTVSIGPTSAATPKLAVGGGLQVSNTSQNIPAWGDVGAQFSVDGAVLTDTSSSGTVSRIVVNSLAASALAASNVTTYTQAATLFISNAPTANTNVTITHRYALFIAGGRVNFQGLPTSAAGLQAGTLWNDAGTLKVA